MNKLGEFNFSVFI